MERIMQRLQQDLRMRNLSEETMRTYTYSIKRFAKATGVPLEAIDDTVIRDYLYGLVLEGRSPSHVNHERAALFFLVEITLGHVVNKKLVPAMKISRKLPSLLSRNEIARIIDGECDLRNKCLWMLGYGSGLRKSEAISLRADDVRSDDMRLLVRCGKRGKDRFTILPEATLAHLRRWWRVRPSCEESWLFPSKTSTSGHITRGSIDHAFPAALASAHIHREGISYHSLRHGFASHLVEDGIGQFTLQELMGHSSLSSTAVYDVK